jgi:hypothetical protein
MLTRFNLGSIPSTAKSTLGLKIKMVRIHQFFFSILFFTFPRGRAKVVGVHYFLVICVTKLARLFLPRGALAFLGAYQGRAVVRGWTVTPPVKKLELTLCLGDKLHNIKGINNDVLLQVNRLLLHIL